MLLPVPVRSILIPCNKLLYLAQLIEQLAAVLVMFAWLSTNVFLVLISVYSTQTIFRAEAY